MSGDPPRGPWSDAHGWLPWPGEEAMSDAANSQIAKDYYERAKAMSDIVKQARHSALLGIPDFTNSRLLDDLADEVERLRAEVEMLRTDIKWTDSNYERLTADRDEWRQKALAFLDPEVERLRAVRDIADLLVNECEGGRTSPSLGILARLESALAMEHKARAALERKP